MNYERRMSLVTVMLLRIGSGVVLCHVTAVLVVIGVCAGVCSGSGINVYFVKMLQRGMLQSVGRCTAKRFGGRRAWLLSLVIITKIMTNTFGISIHLVIFIVFA